MRKIIVMAIMAILLITFIFAIASIAYAADGDVAEMGDGFYSWGMLATYAGALAATTLITQFLKGIWPKKIPTQFLCYIIAIGMLILANLFNQTLSWETAGISVINAIVIALAANGVFNNIVESREKLNKY